MQDERQPLPRDAVRPHETIAPDLRQVVLAPEQVELHLPIAGPTSRMLAYLIDSVVVAMMIGGLVAFVLLSTSLAEPLLDLLRSEDVQNLRREDIERMMGSTYLFYLLAALVLAQYLAELVYFTVWEMVWSGRSLGKAILRLRVVADGGHALSLRDSLARNLLRIVDVLPSSYLVGLTSMLMSPEGKRLGDIAAGTIVIRLDRPPAPPPLARPETSAFRFDRAQIGRVGPLDRQLVLQTLRRVDALPPEHAAALLERTVEVIRQRIGYGEVTSAERRAFLHAVLDATGGP